MQLRAWISKPKTKGSYGETYGPFSFLGKEVLYQWISLRWSMKRIGSSRTSGTKAPIMMNPPYR